MVYFLVKKVWFTFPGRAVVIEKNYLVYFLVKKIWFTYPGSAVAIEKHYLVYFLVKKIDLLFQGGQYFWLNLVGLLFSGLLTRDLTSRDAPFCWFTLVYLVY